MKVAQIVIVLGVVVTFVAPSISVSNQIIDQFLGRNQLQQTWFQQYTISGFSAGGSLAVIHQIVHSDRVSAVGLIGGSPYGCNVLPDSSDTCSGWRSDSSAENTSIPWNNYLKLCQSYLETREINGFIDSLSNLKHKPVYLVSGTKDSTVFQQVMRAVSDQFTNLGATVKSEFSLDAEHSWVVDNITCDRKGVAYIGHNDRCCAYKPGYNHQNESSCPLPPNAAPVPKGGCCGLCSTNGWRPPINNCDYDMTGEMFQFFFQNEQNTTHHRTLLPRGQSNQSHLFQFNQSQFLPAGVNLNQARLLEVGFIYIPDQCRQWNTRLPTLSNKLSNINCTLHIHYHPCGGNWKQVSTNYMLGTGHTAYAESNDMIILYPQTVGSPNSTDGCWDWYGGTGAEFDTKSGLQLTFVTNVIDQLSTLL